MQFFLDSAHVHEISYALESFNIDGVTTNPRHVQVSGKPFMTVIREIAKLVEGTEKTISVEVNPHFMTYEEMLPEAEKLAAISPNFVIKLQCVEPAFRVIETLNKSSNHLGLFSEDADEDYGQWGNFPQTYSHVGLVNAVYRLSKKRDNPIFL